MKIIKYFKAYIDYCGEHEAVGFLSMITFVVILFISAVFICQISYVSPMESCLEHLDNFEKCYRITNL